MAVVVPGTPGPERDGRPGRLRPSPTAGSCQGLVADGVRRAQAGDLDGAERSLTTALSCDGAAALRELAGVRLLQRRWADVESLASTAVRVEPQDKYGWQLLGTSRFVQNEPMRALAAWNQAGEPRIDLLRVAGLTRTRQRPVERLLNVTAGEMLTPAAFLLARRRLADLPSATSTQLAYVPVPSALAELRATVNERPIVPADVWSYGALGAVAAARREVRFSPGSLAGGGERFTVSWRFWPDRPRFGVSLDAPAPWGGVWGLRAFTERQPFDTSELPPAERTSARVEVANWIASVVRLSVHGGLDRWQAQPPFVRRTFGAAGAALQLRSPGDLVDAALGVSVWSGSGSFSITEGVLTARTSPERRHRVLVGRAGAGMATAATPPDVWFGGDTGATRDTLLRAHPSSPGAGCEAASWDGKSFTDPSKGSSGGRSRWPGSALRCSLTPSGSATGSAPGRGATSMPGSAAGWPFPGWPGCSASIWPKGSATGRPDCQLCTSREA